MDTTGLLGRLRELLPVIRARRDEIERGRSMPRDLVDALRETGVFSLEVPHAIGGQEAAPVDIMRAIETVAAADGATGWCVGLAVSNNGVAGFMEEGGAREVFADPKAPTAGIFAPLGSAVRVEGGVRISGRWPFASGINHCDWVWAGCQRGAEMIHAFMRTSEIEIHDTWRVSGLCGTGSNDISAKDVFVPERRVFAIGDPARQRPEPLYRLPVLGAFVSHVAAVSLGIARGALDELIQLAQTKTPTFSSAVIADKVVAQVELARAEALLAAARAFFYETVGDLWQTVLDGTQPTARQIARMRIATTQATEVGASVTRTVNQLAGGSAIYASSSLQRHMRDAEAIAHHFTVAPYVWEDAGRVFMGRAPTAPLF